MKKKQTIQTHSLVRSIQTKYSASIGKDRSYEILLKIESFFFGGGDGLKRENNMKNLHLIFKSSLSTFPK